MLKDFSRMTTSIREKLEVADEHPETGPAEAGTRFGPHGDYGRRAIKLVGFVMEKQKAAGERAKKRKKLVY